MSTTPTEGGRRIEPREMRTTERQPLQDVIPLAAPYLVYIEPTSSCNFKCAFCPTGDPALLKQVGRKAAMMSIETYTKVIQDIKAFGTPLKLLSLYKDGEPLLHKQFPEMVRIAKREGVAERIWTKTNASLLTPALSQELVDAGLSAIHISVEATTKEGYKAIAKVDIDYDQFLANIADLYRRRGDMQIYIKIADTSLTEEEKAKFYADFQPYSTHIAIEKLMGWSNSSLKDFTLGTNPDTYDGAPLVKKIACAYPFYVLAVNCDGQVSVCGNDWSRMTSVGNVHEETLMEIWRGEKLFEFQKMQLEGRRGLNKACGDCYYLQIVPDNLDAHRKTILANIQQDREARCACP